MKNRKARNRHQDKRKNYKKFLHIEQFDTKIRKESNNH
jgi:hypothetical protein